MIEILINFVRSIDSTIVPYGITCIVLHYGWFILNEHFRRWQWERTRK
jgi:hypothetical protein